MDDWKLQQGNLGPEPDDANDPDMAMYARKLPSFLFTHLKLSMEEIHV